MAACTCDVSLLNTGRPGCMPVQGVSLKLILVALQQSDGTLNRIDLSATLDSSYVSALINNTDENQRWFPVGNFKNVTNERPDPITEEFEDGEIVKIRDGAKAFSGVIINQTPDLKRKLDSWGCTTFGAYVVTKSGQLIGDGSVDGFLAPIPIASGTWDMRYIESTDTTVPKLQAGFQWETTFDDANLRMLESSNFTSVDLTTIEGLIDLFYTIQASPAPTNSTLTVDITTDYGSPVRRLGISGLNLVTEFDIVGDSSGVTSISSSDEDANVKGRYAITFTSLTEEDVYIAKKAATTGYYDRSSEIVTLPT